MKKALSPRAPRLRPLDTPSPLRVLADDEGTPTHLRLKGRVHRVAGVQERWCIDDEWWREPIHRTYFSLALEDGRVITLFQDRMSGRWSQQ